MNTTVGRIRNVLVVDDRTRRVEDRPLRAHWGPRANARPVPVGDGLAACGRERDVPVRRASWLA
jgi:hypothetical protein